MNGETDNQANWVSAWYAAPSRMLSANLSGRTFRQILHLHAGGEQIRLHLSNRYGDAPITLSSLSVGHVLQGTAVRPGGSAVRFEGQTTVTLEPSQETVSDPVAFLRRLCAPPMMKRCSIQPTIPAMASIPTTRAID